MSTTLFFLVPIGMLAVAWSLCFVGCTYPDFQFGTPYSDQILTDSDLKPYLIAYWPLSDLIGPQLNEQVNKAGPTTVQAQDLTGNGHVGPYVIPFAYPAPTPTQLSAQITNPSLQRGTSIVPGDAGSTMNPLPGSADFGGGYVSIPWSTQNPPKLSALTLEAWIKPGWTGSGFDRVVFSAFINNTGIRIYINDTNQWEFAIGTGPGNMTNAVNTLISIDPASSTPTYVAVTCDQANGGTMQLWINPQASDVPNQPPPAANWTNPMPTGYVPVDPTQAVTFFIGAGENDQPLRTMDNGTGAPLYAFQGQIQSVALYGEVLDAGTILSHYTNGSSS